MSRTLRNTIEWWLASPLDRRHALVGPLGEWRKKREFQILFLKEMGLRPEHHVLDIGCGTLRGGIPLIEYLDVGHYCGVEVRPSVLEEAVKELREAGLEHKRPQLLLVHSLSELRLGRQFDFLWAFSVLIHFSDEVLDGCFSAASRHLKDGGAFYANVNIGDRTDGQWRGFPLVFRTVRFYQDAGQKHGLLVTDLGTSGSLRPSGSKQHDKHILRVVRHQPAPEPPGIPRVVF